MTSHVETLVPPEQPGHKAAPVVEQRLLLHNVPADAYRRVCQALANRPSLRLNYQRGNLEIATASTAPTPREWASDTQRLLLHDVDWQAYDTLLEALDRHHLRITYDRGDLELLTLSPEHEGYKGLFRRVIEMVALEFGLAFKYLGSTTNRRQDLERGLEPDDCFYFKNWERIQGKKRLDLSRDPPPDLVVEIDVTSSSLDRLEIYAKLGVPEVWRFDGAAVRVYQLGDDGKYAGCEHSPTFPMLPLQELVGFVKMCETADDGAVARALQTWVRKLLGKQ